MLPPPTASFNIPSTHDGLALDCRLYIPCKSTIPRIFVGAVVAHPYAPLGGNFDDHVVGSIVAELLRQGVVVVTFNFRGASSSKGRTSWTGKAELGDYSSALAFLVNFLRGTTVLSKGMAESSRFDSETLGVTANNGSEQVVHAIVAGYSFGSMIASWIPPPGEFLSSFSTKEQQDRIAEGANVAKDLARFITSQREHAINPGPRADVSTISEYRAGLDIVWQMSTPFPKTAGTSHCEREYLQIEPLNLRMSYLLVSPLLPPVSSLLTLSLLNNRGAQARVNDHLGSLDALAVYGRQDNFTSAKKLRSWGESLAAKPASKLTFVEVENAGHFWHEDGVELELRHAIRDWVKKIL